MKSCILTFNGKFYFFIFKIPFDKMDVEILKWKIETDLLTCRHINIETSKYSFVKSIRKCN